MLALVLQLLHGEKRLDTLQPLVRIAVIEAVKAPFLFDSANAVLHRKGCKAIPISSRSALYAVWQIGRKDVAFACERCQPMSNQNKPDRPILIGDIVLGLVSLVDQFGTVLSERGRDFRQTERGRQMDRSLSAMFGDLASKQSEGLNTVNSILDRLLAAVKQHNGSNGSNGHNGSPVSPGKQTRTRKPRRRPARRKSNRPQAVKN